MTYSPGSIQPNTLRFDDIPVGHEARLTHTLTAEDVRGFASLTGDYNPIHLDPEYAKKTAFRKPIVHGMLSASFISTMIGMLIPGPGALWMSQTLEFLHQAYVGDVLTVVARVKAKSPSTRLLSLEISITNQFGNKLVVGESTVKVLEPKEEPQEEMKMEGTKTFLVTGGSRGIGAATVRKLIAPNHAIVVNYRESAAEARALVEEVLSKDGRAIAVQGDVAKPADVERIFAEAEAAFGPIHHVVHCAAPGAVPQAFENTDWSSMQKHFDVQVQGAFHCAKRALPAMTQGKSGSFVFIGSIFTDGAPPAQQAAYIAAKAGLSALARSLAVEYGPKGVRFNIVSPGMTQTDMIAHIPDKTKMVAKMNTPLRRLAEPSDIAEVIAFLLSDGARHITGETIRVSGGITMG
jgi:3-oxoacyl-[acyl-carrier protein] reductase